MSRSTRLRSRLALFAAFIALLALCSPAPAQSSADPVLLSGKWEVLSERSSGGSSRTFEFFPDGRVTETSSYNTTHGESITSYKKTWNVAGDVIEILSASDNRGNGQRITIPIPFDLQRLQIVETWETSSSTRTTRMQAVRVGGMPQPAATTSADPQAAAPARDIKVSLAAVPSVKKSRENYYKIERLSLDITVRNNNMSQGTGPLTIHYWIIGRSPADLKLFAELTSGKLECELGSGPKDREFRTSTPQFLNRFYEYFRTSSSYGIFEYEGWVVTVSDPSGRVVASKASKSEWDREIPKLQRLNPAKAYDIRFDEVAGATGPTKYP